MKKSLLLAALTGVAGLSMAQGVAQSAPEMGRVISSTPVISQIGVPRQVCSNESVPVQSQKSGAGAVMGGLAGGAIGNAIGGGGGRAAATMIGIFGGAILGDRIEGGGQTQYQTVQNCTSQTFYENRTTSYNVVYEYAGKQYAVQMPNDPGQFVRLQITPVGGAQYQSPQYQNPQPQSTQQPQTALPANTIYAQQDSVAPVQTYQQVAPQPVYLAAAPVVYQAAYPAYYARPYYPPIGISLNLGWSGGNYGRGHGHRHWR
jgi:uncharacterized protein YcfJ